MQQTSLEFYAGNPDKIAAAALAELWDDLHSGKITPCVALFTSDFTVSQVDLIEETVSEVTGNKPIRFNAHEKVLVDVNDNGLSVGIMPSSWVASLSALTDNEIKRLGPAFEIAYQKMYGEPPEPALTKAVLKPLIELVQLCKKAQALQLVVVEVFLADW